MAHDETSRGKRLNQVSVTLWWLAFFHLFVNGVLAEIEVATQDPSGRLCGAFAPIVERHQASKPEHSGQHCTSRVLIPNTFHGSGAMTIRYLDGLVHPSAIQRHHRAVGTPSWSPILTAMAQHFSHRKAGSATLHRCVSWILARDQRHLDSRLSSTAFEVFIRHTYDQPEQVLLRFAVHVLAALKAEPVFSQLAQAKKKEFQAMPPESFSDVICQNSAAFFLHVQRSCVSRADCCMPTL